MNRLTRPAAIAGVVVILALAFVRSFSALSTLAADNGVPTSQAWMLPLMLDTTTLVATLAVVTLTERAHRWYARALVLVAASLSGAGNIAEVWSLGPVAIVIASVAPIFLLAMTELAVLVTRPPVNDNRAKMTPLFPVGAPRPVVADLAESWRAGREAAA